MRRNLVARRLWCCRNPKVESGGARLDLWRLAGVGSWRTSFVVFLFWLHWVACGILVSWQEMEPTSSAVEAQILKHGPRGKSHGVDLWLLLKAVTFFLSSLARMIWVEDKFEGSYLEVGIPIGSFMKVQEREGENRIKAVELRWRGGTGRGKLGRHRVACSVMVLSEQLGADYCLMIRELSCSWE